MLKKQRFLCRKCNQTFVAETSAVEKYHRISNNTRLSVIDKLVETMSIKLVAKLCDISHHSVTRIMNETADYLEARACIQLPEHILAGATQAGAVTPAADANIALTSTTELVPQIPCDKPSGIASMPIDFKIPTIQFVSTIEPKANKPNTIVAQSKI